MTCLVNFHNYQYFKYEIDLINKKTINKKSLQLTYKNFRYFIMLHNDFPKIHVFLYLSNNESGRGYNYFEHL